MGIQYISSNKDATKLNAWLKTTTSLSFDLETGPKPQYVGTDHEGRAGLDPFLGMPYLVLLGDYENKFVIDVRGDVDLSNVKRVIEDPNIRKYGVNLRFDAKMVLCNWGWYPRRLVCNQITEQIIRTGAFSADDKVSAGQIRKMTSMKALVKRYFKKEIDKDKAMRINFWRTPVGEFTAREMEYFEGDIEWPLRIAEQQYPLAKERGLLEALSLEFDLITVLARMELEGLTINTEEWVQLYQESVAEVDGLDRKLDGLLGLKRFTQEDMFGESEKVAHMNYSSPTKLARKLHKMGYPGFVDPKTNKTRSTASDLIRLMKLEGQMPEELADTLVARRKADKRSSAYGLKFLESIHPITGKIHPDFTQATLVTSRISAKPGVQTIPGRPPWGPRYRHAFQAGDGYLLSVVDASQIEPRITTDITEDPAAIATFVRGGDIYKDDGEAFYGVEINRETPEGKILRNNAKAAWLGLSYGQGKKKFRMFMMLNTGRWVSQEDSDFLYDKFFEVHWVMKEKLDLLSDIVNHEHTDRFFYDDVAYKTINPHRFEEFMLPILLDRCRGDQEKAKKRMKRLLAKRDHVTYAESYGGRKRLFRVDYLGVYASGRNAPVQMGAAHIQKESMVEIERFIQDQQVDAHIINAVHDEIIVKVAADQAQEFYPHHCRIMTEVGQKYLKHVPMLVGGAIADHWIKPD